MKFGGFSVKNKYNAMMKVYKSQLVFNEDLSINKVKHEMVIDFASDCKDLNSLSIIEIYYRAVSFEERIFTWKFLFGLIKTRYYIDMRKLDILVEETNNYLDPSNSYKNIRWHDIIVLLLLLHYDMPDPEIKKSAQIHLLRLTSISPGISKEYHEFTDKIFHQI